MDLVSVLRVLLRRWYVVLPLLLLSIGATFAAWALVTPSYEAKGSLLLRPPAPSTQAQFVESNPYLLYNNLQIPARVTQDVLLQRSELEALEDTGASGTFEVILDPTGSTPLVLFTAVADSEAEAVLTAELAMSRFDALLVDRQLDQGSPEDRLITTEVVAGAATSATLLGSQIRAAGATMALGLIVTVTAALLTEAGYRRRAAVRSQDGDRPSRAHAAKDPMDSRDSEDDDGPPSSDVLRPESRRSERGESSSARPPADGDDPFVGSSRYEFDPGDLARPSSSRS